MEINGVIEAILPSKSFTSKKDGSVFVKYSFVVKESSSQYPKKVVLSVMGEDKWNAMALVVGGAYNFQFDISSREYNNNWYTECNCWKTTPMNAQAQASHQKQNNVNTAAQSSPAPQPSTQTQAVNQKGEDGSDLPF